MSKTSPRWHIHPLHARTAPDIALEKSHMETTGSVFASASGHNGAQAIDGLPIVYGVPA